MTVLSCLKGLQSFFPCNDTILGGATPSESDFIDVFSRIHLSETILPHGSFQELPMAACRLPIGSFLSDSLEGLVFHGILQKFVSENILSELEKNDLYFMLQNKLKKGTCAGEAIALSLTKASRTLYSECLDIEQQKRLAMFLQLARNIKTKTKKHIINLNMVSSKLKDKIHVKSLQISKLSQKSDSDEKISLLKARINSKIDNASQIKRKIKSLVSINVKLSSLEKELFEKAQLLMMHTSPIYIEPASHEEDIGKALHNLDLYIRNQKVQSIHISCAYNGKPQTTHRVYLETSPLVFYDLKIGKIAYSSKEDLSEDLRNYFLHYNVTKIVLRVVLNKLAPVVFSN